MNGPPPWPGQEGPPPWPQGPHQQQQPPQWPQAQPSSGKATASLVLGILGLVLCPLVCSVAALITGYKARREIRASQGWITGEGNAKAGIVLGWIGVVLTVLLILFFVALAILVDESTVTYDEDTYYDSIGRGVVLLAARGAGLAA